MLAAFGDATETGWLAEAGGPQLVNIRFRQPIAVGRVRLVFEERDRERTQEFTLTCADATGATREIVRQQFTFSPGGATRQIEEFVLEVEAVTELGVRIVADIANAAVPASLRECRISARRLADVPRQPPVDEPATAAVRQILQAYQDMPGMSLTRAQACLLFDLDPDQCDRVVAELTSLGVMHENDRGQLIAVRVRQ